MHLGRVQSVCLLKFVFIGSEGGIFNVIQRKMLGEPLPLGWLVGGNNFENDKKDIS